MDALSFCFGALSFYMCIIRETGIRVISEAVPTTTQPSAFRQHARKSED